MTAKDILIYQFGNSDAIQRCARNKKLAMVGAILVLITAIPRNYDQTYIGEAPWWPLIPLLFSFVSGSFVFLVLKHGFLKQAIGEVMPRKQAFWLFLGLFWMTAPVAWLYAIPAERMFNSYQAAIFNVSLLGVVSIWRLVLLSRAVSVVFQTPKVNTFFWVVVAAGLEVVLILVVSFFTTLGNRVFQGMAGMRNSPEEGLLLSVVGYVFWASVLLTPFIYIGLRPQLRDMHPRPVPARSETAWPRRTLAVLFLIWAALAIPPQLELRNEYRYGRLIENGEYAAALKVLSNMSAEDWPPAKMFRPNPYEWEVWEHLPPLFSASTGQEPEWVRERLLKVYEATFQHRRGFSFPKHYQILTAIERFPDGTRWIRWNRDKLSSIDRKMIFENTDENLETPLINLLQKHGIELKTRKHSASPN